MSFQALELRSITCMAGNALCPLPQLQSVLKGIPMSVPAIFISFQTPSMEPESPVSIYSLLFLPWGLVQIYIL
jgi:hypothetical protein